MKIRFYHMWIYRLYHHFWTPILKERPDLVDEIIAHAVKWRAQNKKPD